MIEYELEFTQEGNKNSLFLYLALSKNVYLQKNLAVLQIMEEESNLFFP